MKRIGLSANGAGRIGRIYLYARLIPELSSKFNGSGVYGFRVLLCAEFPCKKYLPRSLKLDECLVCSSERTPFTDGKWVRPNNYGSIPGETLWNLVKISGSLKMQVWYPFSSSIFCSRTDSCRDNITSRERATLNRFYVVVFNRIQVISNLMNNPADP